MVTSNAQATDRRRARERLADIVETLNQIAAVLDTPSDDALRFETVRRLHRRLDSLNGDLQRMMIPLVEDETTNAASNTTVAPGDLSQWLELLATSRLTAEDRLSLLKAIPIAAYTSARSIRLPQTPIDPVEPRRIGADDWKRSVRWASLYVGIAELSLIEESVSDPKNGRTRIGRIRNAYRKFLSAAVAARTDPSTAEENRIWTSHREFSAELSQFFQSLPSRIGSAAAEAVGEEGAKALMNRRTRMARAARALRLLSARDVAKIGHQNLIEQIRRSALYELLSWQRSRALSARRDAHEGDLALLNSAAASYRDQAASIFGRLPDVVSVPTRLQVDGPAFIDLTAGPFRDVVIQSQVRGTHSTPAWTVLEYDPDIIQVELAPGESAFDMSALRQDRNAGLYPYRPRQPARFVLKPGRTSFLKFRVRRLKPTLSQPALLIVRTITDSEYRRKTITVRLPSPEIIAVEATSIPPTAGTVTQQNEGVVLHPFPNRETEFALSLRNAGHFARVVDVELLASSAKFPDVFPSQEINAQRAVRILAQLRPFRVIGLAEKIEISADGHSVKLQLTAPTKGATAGSPGSANQPENGADDSGGIRVQNGFVLVIRDVKTKGTFFRRIAFAPQRPRRFLRPKLSYDRTRRVIDVRFVPFDSASLPLEPIKIAAELRPTGVANDPVLAEAQISRDNPHASLSLPIPAQNDRIVEVWIHVDGFPRAFIYRIPTDRNTADLPELIGRKSVRIVEPSTGLAISSKTKSIAATIQVDAPVGSFQNGTDFVEFGTDVNRDRKLSGDPSLRFRNDRQIDLRLKELTADGTLKFRVDVTDFHVRIPTVPLNQRVNLLGRLVIGGKTEWSRPLQIILDAQPPKISRITNVVETVEKPFKISVNVTDHGLSGVTKVEFLLDVSRTGQFPAEAESIPGKPGPLGNWSATIDPGKNPPGNYTILVRATDRVGNVSQTV
ncbi:MAG: hypothetical protein IID45_09440, partial [Planctomycetes bacterium]|nr:hypothetical protein [Planctomycetota bacterium]